MRNKSKKLGSTLSLSNSRSLLVPPPLSINTAAVARNISNAQYKA